MLLHSGNSIVYYGSPGHLLSKTDIFFTSSLLLCCGKHVSALFNVLPASSLGCLWTPLVSIHHPFLPISAPARDVQKNKSNKTSVSLTPKGVAAAGSTWFVTITSPINASMIMKSCQVFRVMSRCLLPSCGQRCPAPAQTMVRSGRRLGAQLVTRYCVIIQLRSLPCISYMSSAQHPAPWLITTFSGCSS